jgi:two-component system alkaline phosphatase synthesis response regulator PhoP
MSKRILLIEDDPGLVLTMTDRLASEGYTVSSALTGTDGLRQATAQLFDLIILDVMLPAKSGLDVCRDLRLKNIQTPIIMVTARGQVGDKVVGLKLGADDYLTKPFEMLELLARIEALLRRVPQPNESGDAETYSFAGVEVDFRGMEVRRNGVAIDLSSREFQLLQYLIRNRGKMLSREEILNGVWGYDAMPTTRTVDTHVAWLRQKLEPNPRHPQFILTAHGFGYKFAG